MVFPKQTHYTKNLVPIGQDVVDKFTYKHMLFHINFKSLVKSDNSNKI